MHYSHTDLCPSTGQSRSAALSFLCREGKASKTLLSGFQWCILKMPLCLLDLRVLVFLNSFLTCLRFWGFYNIGVADLKSPFGVFVSSSCRTYNFPCKIEAYFLFSCESIWKDVLSFQENKIHEVFAETGNIVKLVSKIRDIWTWFLHDSVCVP